MPAALLADSWLPKLAGKVFLLFIYYPGVHERVVSYLSPDNPVLLSLPHNDLLIEEELCPSSSLQAATLMVAKITSFSLSCVPQVVDKLSNFGIIKLALNFRFHSFLPPVGSRALGIAFSSIADDCQSVVLRADLQVVAVFLSLFSWTFKWWW